VEQQMIAIKFRPGKNRAIPAIQGKGMVVRCQADGEKNYLVSCKLTRIEPPGSFAGTDL
jgi:hypothetical protein